MRVFYIDYENVMDNGLNGIGRLTLSDIVNIYYSEDAQRMSFGTHRRIIESKAEFTYHKISPDLKTIKNAVDFQIISDLESTMKADKVNEYFIVSNDTDFDKFINEKLKKKYKIKRIREVCVASSLNWELDNSKMSNRSKVNSDKQRKQEEADTRKKKEQVIRSYIGRYLKEYNDWKEYIVEAYMDSFTRLELNNKLQQSFENEDVSEIMARLNKLIKDMPGR